MLKIATKKTETQLSPILFDNLAKHPIQIRANIQMVALLAAYIETILAIGDLEHTGDWDPYLKIRLTNNTSFETVTGYPDILFKDFSDDQQETALSHYSKITSIGFYIGDDEDPIISYYKLSDIYSIQLVR